MLKGPNIYCELITKFNCSFFPYLKKTHSECKASVLKLLSDVDWLPVVVTDCGYQLCFCTSLDCIIAGETYPGISTRLILHCLASTCSVP